jgi:hypothetical protein
MFEKGNIAVYAHIMLLILNASLMYGLKKIEINLRVNLLGPGPSSYKKIIYRAAVSQRLGNTALLDNTQRSQETFMSSAEFEPAAPVNQQL